MGLYQTKKLLHSKGNHQKNEKATWMELEIIILSKVSQKEKDKYHISHIGII